MKEKILFNLILFCFCIPFFVDAQEFRGGEIWFERLDMTEYNIYFDIYLYSEDSINQTFLLVKHIEIVPDTAYLVTQLELGNNILLAKFKLNIVFPNDASNYPIIVIPFFSLPELQNYQSTLDSFYLSHNLFVPNPIFSGINNSPFFSNEQTNHTFDQGFWTHAPKVIDLEGDDLTYSFVDFTFIDSATQITNYNLPMASEYIAIDSLTGKVTWEKPIEPGFYLIGINVTERLQNFGTYLSEIRRVMVVEVKEEDIVTNTEELDVFSTLNLFPNPTQDQLLLQLDDILDTDDMTLEISNLLGQVIHQERVVSSGGQLSVDTSRFPEGSYFLTLRSEGGQVTKGFVVQRE